MVLSYADLAYELIQIKFRLNSAIHELNSLKLKFMNFCIYGVHTGTPRIQTFFLHLHLNSWRTFPKNIHLITTVSCTTTTVLYYIKHFFDQHINEQWLSWKRKWRQTQISLSLNTVLKSIIAKEQWRTMTHVHQQKNTIWISWTKWRMVCWKNKI